MSVVTLILHTVGALIMRLSNSVAKINLKKAIIYNRASHAGYPVSIVASRTFLVASRKAVAEHPLAVSGEMYHSMLILPLSPRIHNFGSVLGTLPKFAL